MPVKRSTQENVRKAMHAALRCARENKLESVSFPGMGKGTGWVPYKGVARIMLEEIREELNCKESTLKLIAIVAHSEEFYNSLVEKAESIFGR